MFSKKIENFLHLSMSGIKIAIPTGEKSSKTSIDTLKVSIAVSAYKSTVQWAKGSRTNTMGPNASNGWKSHIGEQKNKVDIK